MSAGDGYPPAVRPPWIPGPPLLALLLTGAALVVRLWRPEPPEVTR